MPYSRDLWILRFAMILVGVPEIKSFDYCSRNYDTRTPTSIASIFICISPSHRLNVSGRDYGKLPPMANPEEDSLSRRPQPEKIKKKSINRKQKDKRDTDNDIL